MIRGLVLGGGGLVGLGYHAGVLKALDEWGARPAGFDVIVGTSAGAIVAAYLRAGWTGNDFYDFAYGRRESHEHAPRGSEEEVRRLFTPLWSTRSERLRRTAAALYATATSRGYWHVRDGVPSERARRAFPLGMYSTDETRRRLETDLPQSWPERCLLISAVDVYTGARVAFGSATAPPARPAEAVLASTAIPGLFPPVRIGERYYADGGVKSATSLDLAAGAGCDAILCIAPLAYGRGDARVTRDARLWPPMLVRAPFARVLAREATEARARGADVLIVRPSLTELRAHGTNSLRSYDRAAVVESARSGTLRLIEGNPGHPVVEALGGERSGRR